MVFSLERLKKMTNEELRLLINEIANELSYRASHDLNTRESIIKRAIKDIEDLKFDHDKYRIGDNYHNILCRVQVITDKERRTVVVLLRSVFSGAIISRGLAICHPDDCFNIHIGIAISLRRALGLEVPEEYLNVPQPVGVKVGDIVESRFANYKAKVVKADDNRCYYEDGWDYINCVRVIDDSNRLI